VTCGNLKAIPTKDNAMNLRQSIHQHLGNLPESLQAEVFDFVLFLEQKQSTEAKGKSPAKQSLADRLLEMPDCGLDEDFARVDESGRAGDVFN
jgi:hypothetical protein